MSVNNNIELRDCTNTALLRPRDLLPHTLTKLFDSKHASLEEIANDPTAISFFLTEFIYQNPDNLKTILNCFPKNKYETQVEISIFSCANFDKVIDQIKSKFKIHRINIFDISATKNQVQYFFNSLPNLRQVEFDNSQLLTNEDLASLKYPEELEALQFTNCHVDTKVVSSVLAQLPLLDTLHINGSTYKIYFDRIVLHTPVHLSELRLENCVLSDNHVRAITKLFDQVKRMAFWTCTGTSEKVFSDCSFNENLQELELIESTISDEVFKKLVRARPLKTLNLFNCKNLTAAAFVDLEISSTMRELILRNMAVNAQAVQSLFASCPCLEVLDLAHCKSLKPEDFYDFSYPRTLRSVDFSGTWIDLKGVNLLLLAFPNIESVSLRGCQALPADCRYDNLGANALHSLLERHKDELPDSPNRGKVATALFDLQL